VLALTHIAAGAAIASRCRSARTAAVLGLASHLALDGVDHDDDTLGARAQGVLALGALVALLRRHRPLSPVVVGGLAGLLPDAEIALAIAGHRKGSARFLFPSHWGPPGSGHPYRLPRLFVPVVAELVVASLAVAALTSRRWRTVGA
jgi:hypothetical protein